MLEKEKTKRSIATRLRKEHSQWRDTNFSNKEGFFPVFYDFNKILPNLSGGAVSLFIYIGLHSNNLTGECYHSIEKIAAFFDKSPRTISKWIHELENAKLIERFQLEINGPSHTFIRPYSYKED